MKFKIAVPMRVKLFLSGLMLSVLVCESVLGAQSDWTVAKQIEKTGKFKVLWQTKLPIGEKENLDQLYIIDGRLYTVSDRNYMVALNREKGNVILSNILGTAGLEIVGLELYEDTLFSIVGNELFEINPEFGTVSSKKRLSFQVTCPAARNKNFYYIGGVDTRLHILRAEDKVQLFEASAQNDSTITSILADEKFVVFATDKGNVISMQTEKRKKLWQFDAADAVAGTIVRSGNSLYFAGKDTNVYKIDILTGDLEWKYQTAALLNTGPKVTDKIVYQYVRNQGLIAIDNKSGKLIWELANGLDLLAQSAGKAYVITSEANLVVMDNKKAKQLTAFNIVGVNKYVSNTADSRIYIAEKGGWLACIEPIE